MCRPEAAFCFINNRLSIQLKFEITDQDLLSYLSSICWFMEPYEGVDDDTWASYEPGWVGIGEGVEPGTSELWTSPPRGGHGDGEI